MKYYIITQRLAEHIGCIGQRIGNANDGYLVNSADMDENTAVANASEIKEVSLEEAKRFAKTNIAL